MYTNHDKWPISYLVWNYKNCAYIFEFSINCCRIWFTNRMLQVTWTVVSWMETCASLKASWRNMISQITFLQEQNINIKPSMDYLIKQWARVTPNCSMESSFVGFFHFLMIISLKKFFLILHFSKSSVLCVIFIELWKVYVTETCSLDPCGVDAQC